MPTLAAFLRALRKEWIRDNTMQHAAAIAYYALLSFFPFLLLVFSLLGSITADDADRIAETAARIIALKRGNYFMFFPSFEFLERVLAIFDPPDGFTVLRQEREMRAPEVEGDFAISGVPGRRSLPGLYSLK